MAVGMQELPELTENPYSRIAAASEVRNYPVFSYSILPSGKPVIIVDEDGGFEYISDGDININFAFDRRVAQLMFQQGLIKVGEVITASNGKQIVLRETRIGENVYWDFHYVQQYLPTLEG